MRPLSDHWGAERGTPLDRVYIERFLAAHAADIGGNVMEVRDRRYTTRFGSGVGRSDVLDIDEANTEATIIADIADLAAVPADTYDCFIVTQTLQYVPRLAAAIAEVHRVLRPGGVALCSVPSIIRVDPHADVDLWRFTLASCRMLFEPAFGSGQVEVAGHGNLVVASAFLAGAAAEDLSAARRAPNDPRFPIVITVRAVKRAMEAVP
jgi:SAM-dependent methyltransferase